MNRPVVLTILVLIATNSLVDAKSASTKAQCVAACTDAIAQTCTTTRPRKLRQCRAKLIRKCRRFGTTQICPTTTTTSATSTTTTTTTPGGTASCSAQWCDRGATVYDTATGLEWEKKTTRSGSGVDPDDLHDVDNTYQWAGLCSVNVLKQCQPNQAAEDTCNAYTDLPYRPYGCQQCVGDDGTCEMRFRGPYDGDTPNGITTVWDWLNQLNAANYAGHSDWRLPSQSGCNATACYDPNSRLVFDGTCDGRGGKANGPCPIHELETIVHPRMPRSSADRDDVCRESPCIAPIFGDTQPRRYWSSTTRIDGAEHVWSVSFSVSIGPVADSGKNYSLYVRAVRNGTP